MTAVVGRPDAAFADDDAEALHAFGIDLDEVRRRAEGPSARERLIRLRPEASRSGVAGSDAGAGSGRTAEGPVTFRSRAGRGRSWSWRCGRRSLARISTSEPSISCSRSCDPMNKITTAVFERLDLERTAIRTEVIADLRQAA